MFPWQSGSNGREESQQVHLNPKSGNWISDNSRLQRHVNAAIAWNVWQFYQVTGDMEFLSFYGADMILEIARFWASMTSWNEEYERYEILGVMGPDEYHDAYPDKDQPGLDNNAYTNIMAVWTLTCAMKVLDTISAERREELYTTLELDDTEISQWDEIKAKASETIIQHGGPITHHHAVGRVHRPWYEKSRPPLYGPVLSNVKKTLDPQWILNPEVLLGPEEKNN